MKRGRFIGIMLLLGLAANLPAAEPDLRISPKPVSAAVKAVVTAQLAALQAGDIKAAYAFAARGIRMQFDERLFGLLMLRGYAPLLQHRQADLGLVRDNGAGAAEVPVTVIDGRKLSTSYRYQLVLETSGWKVSGVVLEQKPPHGDT
jgi:hypothetical protein